MGPADPRGSEVPIRLVTAAAPNSDRRTWEQPPGVAAKEQKSFSNFTPAIVGKKGTAQPSDPLVPVRTWPNASTAFAPIRKPTLVSKSLWYNLETLGNQYPDKNIFRGLKYRTTILKSIKRQVSDPAPLNINNVLYKGVTPIINSVSLVALHSKPGKRSPSVSQNDALRRMTKKRRVSNRAYYG
ncbi:hypothetical protein F4810DRAFT_373049 [Camillea tinctor]|nr:hypothetical protein F4810DRAFT_373049 [Camillea tinctor]